MDENEISELVTHAVAEVFAAHLPTFRDEVCSHVMEALKPAIEATQAKDAGELSEETATDAQYQVTKAAQQASASARTNGNAGKKTIVTAA